MSSLSNTPCGPTGGRNANTTPNCHVHLYWSLLLAVETSIPLRPVTCIQIGIEWQNVRTSPPCCTQAIPARDMSRASRLVLITGIYVQSLPATRDPSLLANLWPGNLAQVSTYSRIRLVHEGFVKGQKTGTSYFPSGLDTGRVFALSQQWWQPGQTAKLYWPS